MFALIKKIVIYLILVLGIIYGYQFMTGKSIATLPQEIVDKLQQKDTKPEKSTPRYFSDPEKNIPKN